MRALLFLWAVLTAPVAWAETSWFDANRALFACRNGDAPSCETVATAGGVVIGEFYVIGDMPALSPETLAKIPDLIVARREACDAGNQTTCVEIADLLYLSSPDAPPIESFDLYARACDLGDTNACLGINSVSEWTNAQEDQTMALTYYKTQGTACERGDTTACVNQARLNTRLRDETPDPAVWRSQFEAACDAGHARACSYLGDAFGYWGGVEYEILRTEFRATFRDNLKVALDYYKKACDLGSSAGCWDAASAYRLGDGVAEDINLGSEYDLRSCLLGAFNACLNVQDDWAYRLDVPDRAVDDACRKGFVHACYLQPKAASAGSENTMSDNIAFCEAGAPLACADAARQLREAGQPDDAEPYAFAACHTRGADGCAVLGDIYRFDRGSSENMVTAKAYYDQACDGGSPLGCLRYAEFFENGLAGDVDKEWARDLYYQVCYDFEPDEITEQACTRADNL